MLNMLSLIFQNPLRIAIFGIVSLILMLYVALHKINGLQAENAGLTQEKQQLKASLILKEQLLEKERQITQHQVLNEQQQQRELNEDTKIIYRTLQNTSCATTDLPADILKRLR